MTVELCAQDPMESSGPGMSGRNLFGSGEGAWDKLVIMEWDLTATQWEDQHPYDEFNFVLEGELHVESDGERVIARAGDLVRVAAHTTGIYSAPQYARMLAIYDHNPDGADSTYEGPSPVA